MPVVQTQMTLDGARLQDPKGYPGNSEGWLGMPNSFVLPRGKKWGRGWVLMLWKDLKNLSLNSADHKLKFVCGNVTVEIKKLLITNYRAVTGSTVLTDSTLMVVSLADKRYLGRLAPEMDTSFNVSSPDVTGVLYKSSRDPTPADWTWATLLDEIWSHLTTLLGTLDKTGGTYPAQIPAGYNFAGVSAWEAFWQVLKDSNHTLGLDYEGNFKLIPLSLDTEPTFKNFLAQADQRYLVLKSHSGTNTAHSVPAKVTVVFPRLKYDFQNSTDPLAVTPEDYWQFESTKSLSYSPGDLGLAAIPSLPGTEKILYDNYPALYDSAGTATNDAAIVAQAQSRAKQYYQACQLLYVNQCENIYHGLIKFTPPLHALCSLVAWYDTGEGMHTQVVLDADDNVSKQGWDFDGNFADLMSHDSTGPSDIIRRHPSHPRFLVAKLYGDLAAFKKVTANKVQYATDDGTTLTWNNTGLPHTVDLWEGLGNSYLTDDYVLAYWNQQWFKWVVIGGFSTAHVGYGQINYAGDTFPYLGQVDGSDPTKLTVKKAADCRFHFDLMGSWYNPGAVGHEIWPPGNWPLTIKIKKNAADYITLVVYPGTCFDSNDTIQPLAFSVAWHAMKTLAKDDVLTVTLTVDAALTFTTLWWNLSVQVLA